jgi:hypothetical protein
VLKIWHHKWGHRLAVVSLAYVFFFFYFHDYRYFESYCYATDDNPYNDDTFYIATSTIGAMSASYTINSSGVRINERPYIFPIFAEPEEIKSISFSYSDFFEMGLLEIYVEHSFGKKITFTPGWISKPCWAHLKEIQEKELPATQIIEK